MLYSRPIARLSIVHTTEYAYRDPAALIRHKLMLPPDDSHDLHMLGARLEVELAPARIHWTHDVFDNSICFLEWPEALRTTRVAIVPTLDLVHPTEGPPLPVYSLEPGAGRLPVTYGADGAADLGRPAVAVAGGYIGAADDALPLTVDVTVTATPL